MTTPRIVFGVMCAKEPTPAVRQLLGALGEQHPIFVHHDHRKTPRFAVDQPNVRFVPEPLDTGWGTWEFVQAIVKTMRFAIEQGRFDYFQILSGSCLPIKPISAFEKFVARRSHDVHMGLINLDDDRDILMSHGYRVLATNASVRQRVLLRARRWYFANGVTASQQSGLGVIHLPKSARERVSAAGRFAMHLTLLARRGGLFNHPFQERLTPFLGSTWFGCSYEVCEFLTRRQPNDTLEQFFEKTKLVDEAYFHTLLGNSKFRIGNSNHFINEFIEDHPRWLESVDISRLQQSDAFFARKFRSETDDTARVAALKLAREAELVTSGRPLVD